VRQRSQGAKGKKKLTEAQRAAQAARAAKVLKFQLALGYTIVAVSAAAGFFINPAIGLGLAVLAGIRLYALRKELRRQSAEETDDAPTAPRRSIRTSAKHAS
jgi:hypothetical protein